MGRRIAAVMVSIAALAYAIAVVVVAARAPDKGFLAFSGRQVVDVSPDGPAARAGLARGDVIVAIDGEPIRSALHYATRIRQARAGDTVTLTVERAGTAAPLPVAITLAEASTPWPALAATGLAALLLFLGLLARFGRPGDVAARRFFRTTVVYAMVYAGALSWVQLVDHPVLLGIFFLVMSVAASVAADFTLVFPEAAPGPRRRVRLVVFGPALVLCAGLAVSMIVALGDYRRGATTDRGLEWAVVCIAGLLVHVLVNAGLGLSAQVRRARRATGAARSQAKWLVFGFSLAMLPAVAAIPAAATDLDRFLLVGYRPYVVAGAILWFAANGLAVLRIGLADVDIIIQRSVVYALASAAAIVVFLAVALSLGALAERLVGQSAYVPEIVAAVAAAALFGPIRGRVTRALDRRFFRDRVHYVAALGDLSAAAARLREPPDLAREVVTRAVAALRARGGALYWGGARMHASGDGFPEALGDPPDGGIAVPIGDDEGTLVVGPRLDGELYSSDDRDLLAAVAGQLAVAFANARAFGTIADLGRTLEAQNREIRDLRDRLEDENLYLRRRLAGAGDEDRIVGSSKAIATLVEQVERVAGSQAIALLTGESGTGKGLVARSIHATSARAAGPFIHVDCGAIPAGVFESELFGHERGAFTGAVRMRRGHFELADGGTLFLDEIGELPLELQPKLLRALQERSFLRVGGSAPVTVDVRIIAATNRKLEDRVARGEFREDLFYRLRVVEIEVPPLRARRGDIPALVDHVLPRLCRRNHRSPMTVTEAAMAKLRGWGWPGNVRELENVLERAVVLAEDRTIDADEISLPEAVPEVEELMTTLALPADAAHGDVMEAIEKQRLEAALRAAGGNQSSAARALGMARTTFINKLRRFGLLG
jgi:transcriptional regulator with GAF, ATPase, and Fis domain